MNKRLVKFLKVIIVLILLIGIGFYFFLQNLKPTYEGEKEIVNLTKETTVRFDDYGIPHIYAENEEDAMRTLGYVHAQDRLWQMELMRRIAPGRLAEIFGEVALENDMLFAGLGIDEHSIEAIDLIDKNSKPYLLALSYLDGINQFIEIGPTPVEYYLLGLEKQKFELKDTYNIIGYMAFSFAMAHKTDPVLSVIQSKLGNQYLEELGLEIPANSTLIKNYDEVNTAIALSIEKLLENSPVPAFIGSNSWIVAPDKTKNGNVLFTNDPHIGFSSPSVWYEAHISTPDFESYGYYLGGVPFPLLSHNREFAYGLTMFENDDIDFYQEQNHQEDTSKYLYKNSFRSYSTSQKTIKVKDSDDVVFDVKSTQHGPIMNDLIYSIDSENPIAMSWIYTKMPNRLLNAVYGMSRAKNKTDVKNSVSLIYAPGLNIMYGDSKGNISWWAAAQLYKLPENSNSKLVLNGSNGENEIVDYLNFTQNPQAHNPPWNYVYSANNQPDSIAGMLYPGYYLPEDRAKRIVELLERKDDWTKEDFMDMLGDAKSSVAPDLIKIIIEYAQNNLNSDNEKIALGILRNWDGNYLKSSVAATIYVKFTYEFLVNTFEDEIGKEIFEKFINTHLMKRMIAKQLHKKNSVWWDNINTDSTEDKSVIIQNSFSQTVTALEKQLGNNVNSWTWNRVHTVEHKHPMGEVALLRKYFNVGKFEIAGSSEVINNLQFYLSENGLYEVRAGPSTRRVVDFSDVENSMSILPTGNSGNPMSKFYSDQAEMYNRGDFRKMKMNKEEIEQVSTKLTFLPKN